MSTKPASELISKKIAELGDWRGETLGRMRSLIRKADPDVVEEWKWMGTPVWSHDGIICTGESYKKVVKLTFAKGASLKDPARLFNSSLDEKEVLRVAAVSRFASNDPSLGSSPRHCHAVARVVRCPSLRDPFFRLRHSLGSISHELTGNGKTGNSLREPQRDNA
jgi:hypothetical protein